jgi:hypothetical protein
MRSAYAAAKLMQLRKAEAIGAIYDDRIGGRDIDPALDDRAANEHGKTPVIEIQHDIFEHAFRHLSVRNANVGFG